MKKLTNEQKQQIWIQFRVGGGHEELADMVVDNICAIVKGKAPQRVGKIGRPRLTPAELDCTIAKIRVLQWRNHYLTGRNSISNALSIDRRRIARALKIMNQQKVNRAFTVFGWRHQRPTTPLSK